MTYKTILVHVDETTRSTVRTKIALLLCAKYSAHLIGSAVTGVSRYIFEGANVSTGDPNMVVHLAFLRERAARAIAQFKQDSENIAGVTVESEVTNDEANGGLGLRGRYSDLVVIGQTNRSEPSPSIMSDFPEFMVMNSGRPVLIIPHTGEFEQVGRRVLVAWDGSREAARAVSDAIPILAKSEIVQIIVVNPGEKRDSHGEEPGADLALFLSRHGIKVEIATRFSVHDAGAELLKAASELGMDLIVMGGYGHSRLREMLMGGVTRTILEKMNLPVFMSH
jgi:nucleotide-binding universal stress UspA family protein